jgi:alpha-ketoglutarate-dependent taurine dioxygenase
LEFKDFGTLIDDIRDKGIGGNRPASGNDLHFGLHTDLSFYSVPPSFVNFLMVCPSKEGGESLFCDIREVVKELSLETTERLKSDFLFPPPPRFPNLQPLNAPILTCNGDTFERVRYRHDGLRASNETQEKALCEFERKIWEHTVSLQLGAGQMAFFNNQLLLHGRAEFKDSENENEKRYAVRTYVRPVPPLNLIS